MNPLEARQSDRDSVAKFESGGDAVHAAAERGHAATDRLDRRRISYHSLHVANVCITAEIDTDSLWSM